MHDPTAFYDDFAPHYHLIFDDWEASRKRQAETFARLIGMLSDREAKTILDCACGIGTQALGLAELGFAVTATDLSPKAVEQARTTAATLGLKLNFGVADFRHLVDQVSGDFDIVLASDNALPHLLIEEDMRLAASQLLLKTVPGGHLIISIRDYDEILKSPPETTPVRVLNSLEGRRVYFQIWDWDLDRDIYRFQLFLLSSIQGGVWETRVYESTLRAWQRDQLSTIFKEAGFQDVVWRLPAETGHYSPVMTASRPPD